LLIAGGAARHVSPEPSTEEGRSARLARPASWARRFGLVAMMIVAVAWLVPMMLVFLPT
jgi:hypothetical protein